MIPLSEPAADRFCDDQQGEPESEPKPCPFCAGCRFIPAYDADDSICGYSDCPDCGGCGEAFS